MADLGGADLEAFRADAREWLGANFPTKLAHDADTQLAKLQARPTSAWTPMVGWPTGICGAGSPTT